MSVELRSMLQKLERDLAEAEEALMRAEQERQRAERAATARRLALDAVREALGEVWVDPAAPQSSAANESAKSAPKTCGSRRLSDFLLRETPPMQANIFEIEPTSVMTAPAEAPAAQEVDPLAQPVAEPVEARGAVARKKHLAGIGTPRRNGYKPYGAAKRPSPPAPRFRRRTELHAQTEV